MADKPKKPQKPLPIEVTFYKNAIKTTFKHGKQTRCLEIQRVGKTPKHLKGGVILRFYIGEDQTATLALSKNGLINLIAAADLMIINFDKIEPTEFGLNEKSDPQK